MQAGGGYLLGCCRLSIMPPLPLACRLPLLPDGGAGDGNGCGTQGMHVSCSKLGAGLLSSGALRERGLELQGGLGRALAVVMSANKG